GMAPAVPGWAPSLPRTPGPCARAQQGRDQDQDPDGLRSAGLGPLLRRTPGPCAITLADQRSVNADRIAQSTARLGAPDEWPCTLHDHADPREDGPRGAAAVQDPFPPRKSAVDYTFSRRKQIFTDHDSEEAHGHARGSCGAQPTRAGAILVLILIGGACQ